METITAQKADLFAAHQIGTAAVRNRIVMAPMTRSRATDGKVPSPLARTYYEQRASAGLIVTEGSQISPQGVGYIDTPGIHTEAQIAAWSEITNAVHANGGKIALQLWHVGRVSHTSLQPHGAAPVGPSAIAAEGTTYTYEGMQPFSTPRALEVHEIQDIVRQFAVAARNAITAGMDLVEIHGANGYLVDQFLRDGSNKRTDAYGGSVENRIRFLREVATAVSNEIGADRVGVRFSPTLSIHSVTDSDPITTFTAAAKAMDELGLAYIHVIEPADSVVRVLPSIRNAYQGTLIVAGGYNKESANAVLATGDADMVAFGTPFISNPDLPHRFANDFPLTPSDRATYYGGADKGYTDYPTYGATV